MTTIYGIIVPPSVEKALRLKHMDRNLSSWHFYKSPEFVSQIGNYQNDENNEFSIFGVDLNRDMRQIHDIRKDGLELIRGVFIGIGEWDFGSYKLSIRGRDTALFNDFRVTIETARQKRDAEQREYEEKQLEKFEQYMNLPPSNFHF